ncbi:MAG: hypothetical protein JW712_10360, partial [Dehalococcoidales bacterium]|nr:hypothetical protein [Dehalococcoidales bacterium]
KAVLIGQASEIDDLGTFTPLEESADEGALVLMKLEFSHAPSGEMLEELEQACRETGVESWPGSEFYVYADESSPTVYLVWQKGMAWLPIIVGLLGSIVLPPLLTAGIWLILPDSLKNLISTLMNMGMMMLVMWLMMSVMKPMLSPAKEKPKQIKEHSDERVSSRTV